MASRALSLIAAVLQIVSVAAFLLGLAVIGFDLEQVATFVKRLFGISSVTTAEAGLGITTLAAVVVAANYRIRLTNTERQRPRLTLGVPSDDGSGRRYIEVACTRVSARIEVILEAEDRDDLVGWPYTMSYAKWEGLRSRDVEIKARGRARIQIAEYDRGRGSAAARGYGRRWRRHRETFLAANPFRACR